MIRWSAFSVVDCTTLHSKRRPEGAIERVVVSSVFRVVVVIRYEAVAMHRKI